MTDVNSVGTGDVGCFFKSMVLFKKFKLVNEWNRELTDITLLSQF